MDSSSPDSARTTKLSTSVASGTDNFLHSCIAKNWSANYEDLLLQFNLPSLRQRRALLKLSFFFQIHNDNFHYLGPPVHPSPMDPRLRGYIPARIACLIPNCTKAYKSSFFPDAVKGGMTFLLSCGLFNLYLCLRRASSITGPINLLNNLLP